MVSVLKKYSSALFLVILCNICIAQDSTHITGNVCDTTGFNFLDNSKIYLVDNEDTIITSVNSKHNFDLLYKFRPGHIILLVKNAYYTDYYAAISLKDTTELILDTIFLTPKSFLLDEIVIKESYKSKIEIDTATFIVDSIPLKAYTNVEELLMKIPGISITNGVIAYYGNSISEFSIDGRPFVNFDIHALLFLLRARDIYKLKIYNINDKSLSLSGRNINERKGLNLILKEEAKGGYSGKLAIGGGQGEILHWDNASNISSFNDDKTVIAYANANNTNNVSSIGALSLSGQNSSSALQGLLTNLSAGIYYNSKFLKEDRLSVSVNYAVDQNVQDNTTTSDEITYIPGDEIKTAASSSYLSKSIMNKASIQANYRINALTFLNLNLSSTTAFANGSFKNNSESKNGNSTLLNSSVNSTETRANTFQNNFSLSYIRNFKKGGNFKVQFSSYLNADNSKANQLSSSKLNTSGINQNFDQRKEVIGESSNYTLSIEYYKTLSTYTNLLFTSQSNISSSASKSNTYDRYTDSKELTQDSLNPLFSNHYNFRNTWSSADCSVQHKRRKYSLNAGANIIYISSKQINYSNNSVQTKQFLNFLPFASVNFELSKKNFLIVSYKLQTLQPGLNQIQPIANNTDPLRIIMGNPDLTQSLSHNFSMNYRSSSPIKNRYFNAGTNISFIKDAITTKQNFDVNGKEVLQYVNQNGNINWNLSSNYDFMMVSNLRTSMEGNISILTQSTITNDIRYTTLSKTFNGKINLQYSLDTLVHINYSLGFDYSINSSKPATYNQSKISNIAQALNIGYSSPLGIDLNSLLTWNYIGGQSDIQKKNFIIWNAFLAKNIGKKQSITIKLLLFDILNQSTGYSVFNKDNVRHEEFSKTISRFFMLGLVWNFTKR